MGNSKWYGILLAEVEIPPGEDEAAFLATLPEAEVLAHVRRYYLNATVQAVAAIRIEAAKALNDGFDVTKEVYAGWLQKFARAKLVLDGTASQDDLAVLAIEAQARGLEESVEELAQKICYNANLFDRAGAMVDGLMRFLEDALKAASSPDEVEAAYSAGMADIRQRVAEYLGGLS